jgi:hypothetical protein
VVHFITFGGAFHLMSRNGDILLRFATYRKHRCPTLAENLHLRETTINGVSYRTILWLCLTVHCVWLVYWLFRHSSSFSAQPEQASASGAAVGNRKVYRSLPEAAWSLCVKCASHQLLLSSGTDCVAKHLLHPVSCVPTCWMHGIELRSRDVWLPLSS